MIISRQKNGTDFRFFISSRMTDGGALKAIVRNCILVVYQLVFGAISHYRARSFKIVASNPSGATILLIKQERNIL